MLARKKEPLFPRPQLFFMPFVAAILPRCDSVFLDKGAPKRAERIETHRCGYLILRHGAVAAGKHRLRIGNAVAVDKVAEISAERIVEPCRQIAAVGAYLACQLAYRQIVVAVQFLVKDVVTEFRGRGDEIHIWPLSFAEFMSVYEGSKEEGWAEYLMFGGLPQLLTQVGDDKKADFLRRLYRTVYLRDIYERNPIEMKAEFEELSKIVASSIGAPVNAQNIANTFKSVSKAQGLSVKTISTYLGYMQDSFLIEKSERYDIKGRKYIGALCKYYYQDIGLRNAILSFRQNETTHIMENVIYNEMRMRGWLVDVGNIFHRVRNEAGKQQRVTLEVDFVCNKGSERIYIQSAYKMPDVEKMEQEKRSLKLVDDSFRKIIVVGEHTKTWSDEKGIQIVSIYDFLLTPSFTE